MVYDVIVIGAGHNGLIAAAYLARASKRVLVLERREVVGGACVTEEVWPGYRVSAAAYLCSLLRPEIVRDLELRRHGFEVYRRETAGFAPFLDGSSLFLYPDAERTRESLTEFCRDTPQDVDALFQFEADIERAATILDPWLMREPPTTEELRTDYERQGAGALYTDFFERSVRDLLDRRLRSDRLKAVLATDGLIGTYGGPSTPGTAYVLLHHYLGMALGSRGAWGYVRGGMGHITEALAEVVRESGGEIRCGAEVREIRRAGDHALEQATRRPGEQATHPSHLSHSSYRSHQPEHPTLNTEPLIVTLASGETVEARTVLSNADPYITFVRLFACSPVRLFALSPARGASAKINLAVTELPRFTCLPERAVNEVGPEHLGTIHICPDVDYLERAWEEAKQGIPSTEPMIEVYLQTATDRSLAPEGKHILSLFVQYFPYDLAPGLDLDTERERFADRVIAILARYAPNVPASIERRQILTPRDLEARFGLTGGHIFHGDLLPGNLWRDRPAPGFRGARTPIPGLYLCGSGAHPGGCVFGAPGYNAAAAVLEDLE